MKPFCNYRSSFYFDPWNADWLNAIQFIKNKTIQHKKKWYQCNNVTKVIYNSGWPNNWKRTMYILSIHVYLSHSDDSIWLLPTDAQPTEAETAVWNQVSAVLEEAHGILAELQSYNGAGQEIREVGLFLHLLVVLTFANPAATMLYCSGWLLWCFGMIGNANH